MDAATRSSALITGASSGIGQAFAERLARDGHDLIIVARRRDRLEVLAQQLRQECGVAVEPLVADLTDPEAVRQVEQRVACDETLSLLINNAGFAGYMPFVQLQPDVAEDLISIHVITTTRLTRAALPGMLERRHGAIINVSSMVAFSAPVSMPPSSPIPKRAVYAGCKSYILTFTVALARELEGSGVQLQALCPPATGGTEFHDFMPGLDHSRFHLDAETVVDASLVGLQLGEVVCMPAVTDAALLDQLQEKERELFGQVAAGNLAERYRA